MVSARTDDLKIDVEHITRVEGHGNLIVDIRNGEILRCDLEIIEAPRFFESMLRGRPYHQASHLASRICGICAVTHATVSLMAVEEALGVTPSPQTMMLRKLNMNAEMLDSHILHLFMLIAPDFFEVGSAIALAETRPEIVRLALRMKKIAGEICTLVGGRHTHPISMVVGGFTRLPNRRQLADLLNKLEGMREDLEKTLELFLAIEIPQFERETEYIALRKSDEYSLIGGEIASTDSDARPINQYREITNEFQVFHSTAKHAQHQRDSYMVGALSRLKINYEHLHPTAKSAARLVNIDPQCVNPFMISIAQLVEIIHCFEDSIRILNHFVDQGIEKERPVEPRRFSGEGAGACEAPRGTLYHNYLIRNGTIQEANCIIPTAQNLANIEADMRVLVKERISAPPDDIRKSLEMLIRAYDPCISCSAHFLDIQFL